MFELIWVELEVEDISPLRPDPKEVGEARWISPGELTSLEPLIPGTVQGFGRFLGGVWDLE